MNNYINAIASECNTSSFDVTPRAQQAKIVNQRDGTEFRHVFARATLVPLIAEYFWHTKYTNLTKYSESLRPRCHPDEYKRSVYKNSVIRVIC